MLAIGALCYASFPRHRPGQQTVSLLVDYGALPLAAAYWIRFALCSCMFVILLKWLAHHGTAQFSYRTIWAVYWFVGLWSHVFSWDTALAPAAWKGIPFHAFAAMHVSFEFILCIYAVVPRSEAGWYNDRLLAFVIVLAFLVGFAQQKSLSTLVGVGGCLAVPADCFTLVAGYCTWRRGTDWDAKFFGIAWMMNGVVVCWLMITLAFKSKEPVNTSGLCLLSLIADYVALMVAVHRNVMMRNLPEAELEKELRQRGVLPRDPAALDDDADGARAEGGLMKTAKPRAPAGPTTRQAFIAFWLILAGFGGFVAVVPIVLGKLEIEMLIE